MNRWFRRLAGLACLSLLVVGLIRFYGQRSLPVFCGRPQTGFVLVIDPGHGGEDGGAVSKNGTVESHINLAVAQRLGAVMDLYGVERVLLREEDRSLHGEHAHTLREKKVSDLHRRVELVEGTDRAFLLSIHQNTYPNASCHGAQVFYGLHPDSEAMADRFQTVLRQGLDPENDRVPTKIPNTVYLMNHVTCPAVLVECGFLSTPAEEARLVSPDYQTRLALCLASAYLTQEETKKGESS